MDPIKVTCKRTYYPAARSSGTRPTKSIRLVVLHDTEGGSAESIASYFKSPGAAGSTHLVVDDASCYRCLADSTIPWGASSAPELAANSRGFHIEQCGYARWSLVVWRSHRKTLQRAAFKTAYHCRKFKIPLRFLKAADLYQTPGARGITTHYEVSMASKKLDPANASKYSHTDPGPFWPRSLFMYYVRKYAKELSP